MAPPFHFPTSPKAFPQDMESQLLFRCNGCHIKKDCRAQDVDGLLIMVMMVVCLSFVSIFTVPIGLEKKQGLAGAKEAIDSVGFAIFVVMDAVSFFSSLGVVLVLLQAMPMDDTSQSGIKEMMKMCGIVAQIATGCAAIAFISAATTFTRLL